ncbi:MAG TPA: hypothetical protein VKQ70_00650 [Caulobacteraceae bacterium]|nr:hypothetical protein [Caulobacteraceae bacterium]
MTTTHYRSGRGDREIAAARPLCRTCGKLIPKRTTSLRFGCAPVEAERRLGRVERPATREEAQRYVNGEITQVRYSTRASEDAGHGMTRVVFVPRYIGEVTYWDGESYQDDAFDSLGCAAQFGRSMARQFPDYAMPAYREAKARRAAKESV